jgi:hypothetical protein
MLNSGISPIKGYPNPNPNPKGLGLCVGLDRNCSCKLGVGGGPAEVIDNAIYCEPHLGLSKAKYEKVFKLMFLTLVVVCWGNGPYADRTRPINLSELSRRIFEKIIYYHILDLNYIQLYQMAYFITS